MSDLGIMIRRARREAGLTQRQVADAVGIDCSYLSKIENDRLDFPPAEETIRKIAVVVRADADDVMASSGRWIKVTATQMAAWRRLGQTVDAVLAQASSATSAPYEMFVPTDAITDLRRARVEVERA